MKRSVLATVVALLAIAALPGPGAAAEQPAVKHCRNTYFAPQYLTIKRISAKGTGCSTARGLSLAYMRAVTSSSGAVNHTGHCFGAHSYGHCSVQSKGQTFDCNHFQPVPAKTRGLVRCTEGQKLVKFNIGA